MKSKTSCFNGEIFRRTLCRYWPLWCAYLAFLMIVLLQKLPWELPYDNFLQDQVNGGLLSSSWRRIVEAALTMGALSAMCVFSHLYNQRQTALMCSLPVSRRGVYTSCFAAGLLPMLAADVLAVLACAIAEAAAGIMNLPLLLYMLALLVMLSVGFYGFAAFCAMLTGNLFVLPLVYLVLMVVALAVEAFVKGLLTFLLFGYSPLVLSLQELSPPFWLSGHSPLSGWDVLTGGFTVSSKLVLYLSLCCAGGIVFSLLGLWLHEHRAMETATDVVAVKGLRPVFRYCMAFGCAMAFPLLYPLMTNFNYQGGAPSAAIMTALALLGCAVGYYGSEMLMKKTWRIFRQKALGFFIAGAVVLAGMLCITLDIGGYETLLPAQEEIASVRVETTTRPGKAMAADAAAEEAAETPLSLPSKDVTFTGEEGIRFAALLHGEILDSKPCHDRVSGKNGECIGSLYFTYTLTDGSVVVRRYQLYDPAAYPEMADEVAALTALMNVREAFDSQKLTSPITAETFDFCSVEHIDGDHPEYNPDGSIVKAYTAEQLDAEQSADLYAAIEKDLDRGIIGRYAVFPQDSPQDTDIQIRYSLEVSAEYPPFEFGDFTVTATSENTLAWLKENLGVEPEEIG